MTGIGAGRGEPTGAGRGHPTGAGRGQRGTVSVEAALLVPVLVLVAALTAAGWRLWWAGSQVQAAAQSAARSASQAPTPQRGHELAVAVATSGLDTAGLHCADASITDDVGALGRQAGAMGGVSVTVTCTVDLSDLLVPGLPGSITVTRGSTESIDVFSRRSR